MMLGRNEFWIRYNRMINPNSPVLGRYNLSFGPAQPAGQRQGVRQASAEGVAVSYIEARAQPATQHVAGWRSRTPQFHEISGLTMRGWKESRSPRSRPFVFPCPSQIKRGPSMARPRGPSGPSGRPDRIHSARAGCLRKAGAWRKQECGWLFADWLGKMKLGDLPLAHELAQDHAHAGQDFLSFAIALQVELNRGRHPGETALG